MGRRAGTQVVTRGLTGWDAGTGRWEPVAVDHHRTGPEKEHHDEPHHRLPRPGPHRRASPAPTTSSSSDTALARTVQRRG